MHGAHGSQRKTLEETAKPRPGERAFAVATQEPLPPTTLDFVTKPGQGRSVTRDTVVRVMTAELFIQFLLLFTERQVPVSLTPRVNAPHCSAESISGGLEFDNPVTVPGPYPVVGEAQQVKSPRTFVWLASIIVRPTRRRTKGNESRFGGVDRQSVLAKPLEFRSGESR